MPVERAVHFNPPINNRKTRCGRYLANVKWSLDIKDVTCNRCISLENGSK